jgi:hypothetical protein
MTTQEDTMPRECVTHHHACRCREDLFLRMEDALTDVFYDYDPSEIAKEPAAVRNAWDLGKEIAGRED